MKCDTNIAGLVWSIHWVDPHSPELMVEGTYRPGACWCTRNVIAISNELNSLLMLRVLRHELSHAYMYSTQIHYFETYTEEDVCEFIAIYGSKIVCDASRLLEVYERANDSNT